MDSVQAEHLPKGWAEFVRNLDVRVAGRSVPAAALEGARWRLPAGFSSPVTVTYDVDLAFARTAWPSGNEQAAAVLDDALYIVGRAMFVTGDVESEASVRFDLPPGWRVSTPLQSAGAGGVQFIARNRTQLVRNALVIGRHVSVQLTVGEFSLELALPGAARGAVRLVEPVVRDVLDAYLGLFPGTGPQRYVMVVFGAAADDGEAFTNSAAFTTTDEMTAEGKVVWGNSLAHELMHFWNGQRIRGAGPRAAWRWVAEGFTEYYANLTLARRGHLSTELFLKKVERHLGNYLYFATAPALSRMSLVEAGANTSANRFGVYDGGWTVAFCLDGLIREQSGDRRSLDALMGELWRRFGAQGRGYTIEDLEAVAEEMAGSDLTGFFANHVQGREVLPVRACLGRAGLHAAIKGYAAEVFVFPEAGASPAVLARAGSWYGAGGRE